MRLTRDRINQAPGGRCFRARGTSLPDGPSRSTITPRSPCGKMVISPSSTLGSTSCSDSARPRLLLISKTAFSLACGFCSIRRLDVPPAMFNRCMTVELDSAGSSSTSTASAAGCKSAPWPTTVLMPTAVPWPGDEGFRSSWKTNTTSQSVMRSSSLSR